MLPIPRPIIRRHFTNSILNRHIRRLNNPRNPILTTTANTRTIPAPAVLAHIEAAATASANTHSIPSIRVRHLVSVVRSGVQLRPVARKSLRARESPARAAGAGGVAGGFAVGCAEETGEVSAGDGFHGGAAGGDHGDVDFDGGAAEADVVGWVEVDFVGEKGLG